MNRRAKTYNPGERIPASSHEISKERETKMKRRKERDEGK